MMVSDTTDKESSSAQGDESGTPATKRPWPRRRIAVTATLLGLLALLFYAAEIAVVAFDLAGH
jgi:hypothetical protein